jgi:hypothetical protein
MARTSAEAGGGGTSNENAGSGGSSAGGSNESGSGGQQKADEKKAPEEARDEHGAGLGFPKDTRTEDMTDQQKANYWRNQSKVQQKLREEAERKLQEKNNGKESGTVREQQQGSGSNSNEQVDSAAIRSEAAQDAAMATIRSSLALRGKTADDIDSLVDVLSMAKFVTADHKVDTAKVVAFIEKNAPAAGSNGSGGSDFGAGRREEAGKNRKDAARAEAEKRFAGQKDQPNRGHLGGLRR